MSSGGELALRQEYVIGDEIGRGRFGTVRRCYAVATGEAFAVKSTPKAPLREAEAADALDLALAEQEPKVHLVASAPGPGASPHVVALHAAFEDDAAVHLVVDLCAGGDLLSLVSSRGRLPEHEAADLVAQLASALASCHRRGGSAPRREARQPPVRRRRRAQARRLRVGGVVRGREADDGAGRDALLRGAGGGGREGVRREGGRVERRGGALHDALRGPCPSTAPPPRRSSRHPWIVSRGGAAVMG
ncbi:hypothetical protein OsJ_08793 [Oryza sativa Japonica Group]|uniref:Protein kinase domain-containing protein n=1 Tax=Oryza sativa subsp. japonica TaxID=39947 RepID=B9F449_ORYSJ|nr:hypothetical protein OsJ_08793 [Oryza sativa Japonica Group]